ncbi:MAG TPA: fatty acid desaturase [Gemmatimonadales bacterium]
MIDKTPIRDLHRRTPWRNLRVVTFAAIWTGAGYTALHVAWLPVRLICYFLIGATIQGLVIMMHEGVHRIMFRNRTLNRWVAFLCGVPAFLSVTSYRVGHLSHHRYERSARDPDEIENFSQRPRVVALLLLLMLAWGDLYGLYRVGPINTWRGTPTERRDVLVEYGLIAVAFVAAFALVPLHVLLHVWLLPALVARQLTNVRTVAEHALTGHDNRYTATRTVVSNRFVSFFMCNLNYHIVHHLYPAVPWYNLPALHRLLADEQRAAGAHVYRSYTQFLVDLARFAWRALGRGGDSLPLSLQRVA